MTLPDPILPATARAALTAEAGAGSAPAEAAVGAPSVGDLFAGFFVLGLTGFGGILPMARRMLVDARGWLSADEFTNLIGLCQFLPGGNVMNLSVAVGMRFRGIPGAVASLLGLIAAPSALVLVLGSLYERYSHLDSVRHLFAGLAAAAAGLLIALAVKLSLPLRHKPVAAVLALVCVAAIAGLRLPMLATILALAPVSILIRWLTRG